MDRLSRIDLIREAFRRRLEERISVGNPPSEEPEEVVGRPVPEEPTGPIKDFPIEGPDKVIDPTDELIRDRLADLIGRKDLRTALEDTGLEELTTQDVADALPLILEDTQQANTEQALDNSSGVTGGSVDLTGGVQAPAFPPLPTAAPGESELDTVAKQLQHIVNNVAVNQPTTNVDNSLNQQIDNRGGIVEQTIDLDPVTAIGDDARAAGDNLTNVEGDGNLAAGDDLDINDSNVVTGSVRDAVLADDIRDSNVTVGDDNQVGDGTAFGRGAAVGKGNVTGDRNVLGEGNQAVTGDGSQGAFGDGAQALGGTGNQAAGDDLINANLQGIEVDDGGALAIGGDADGRNTEIDITDSEDINVANDDSTAGDSQFTVINNSEDVDVDQGQATEQFIS